MINFQRTIEVFGYKIPTNKVKKVIHNCDCCGKERAVEYRRALKLNYFCHPCTLKGKNNFFYNKHFIGNQNGHWKDGISLKEHFCSYPGCTRTINLSSIYFGGMCHLHGHLGEKNGRYIDGRTPITILIRGCQKAKDWVLEVFKRDDFKCQKCGKTNCSLNAHHNKKPFKQILKEFLQFYSNFSPIEDKETLVRLAQNWPEFWDTTNGETLCEDCHDNLHSEIGK